LASASSAVIRKGNVLPRIADQKTAPAFPITPRHVFAPHLMRCVRLALVRRYRHGATSPPGTLCLAAWKANSRRQRPALAFYDDISNDIGETVDARERFQLR
jgi:hypothetical protein